MIATSSTPTVDALQRRHTSLTHAVAVLALGFALAGTLAFTRGEQHTRLREIDVGRIDIIVASELAPPAPR